MSECRIDEFYKNKMFQRMFSRVNTTHYIIISILLMLFVVYEMKLWYAKYQKGKRFIYYNTYVNEVHKLADKIEWTHNKSSVYTRQLSRLLQVALKRDNNS